jgi:hypothetical protein
VRRQSSEQKEHARTKNCPRLKARRARKEGRGLASKGSAMIRRPFSILFDKEVFGGWICRLGQNRAATLEIARPDRATSFDDAAKPKFLYDPRKTIDSDCGTDLQSPVKNPRS